MATTVNSLYDLLPAFIRRRDQENGAVLQQWLSIANNQSQALQRDLQQMYDDWFIETCSDWIVPYIADLRGYVPASGANGDEGCSCGLTQVLAPRREVGNLLAHRRRKGTVVLLEVIARDIAAWPAVAVEFFQRLAVAQHVDHLQPGRPATLDVHDALATEWIDSPFVATCHVADVHRTGTPRSSGHFNVPSVRLFAFRMKRYPVSTTPAYCREDVGLNCYSFSILSNDVQLYRLPGAQTDPSHPTRRNEVPLAIGRLELEAHAPADAKTVPADPGFVGAGRSFALRVADWPRKGAGGDIDPATLIPADLSTWTYKVPKNRIAIDPVLGRIQFPRSQPPPPNSVVVSYGYGFAMDLGGGEYLRPPLPLPRDLQRVRVRAAGIAPQPGEYASVPAAIADWHKGRPAAPAGLLVELVDSGLYTGRLEVSLGKGESLWIVAAPGARPVYWLTDDNAGGPDAVSVKGSAESRFVVDGVLIAGRGIDFGPAEDGDLCQILIRHCTLVPGWGLRHDCEPLRPTEPSILLNGTGACLRIEHSIVGAIRVVDDDSDREPAIVCIVSSIVDATSATRAAIGADADEVASVQLTVKTSTIVGTVLAHSIPLAENSLFLGAVTVARRQVGCVRYRYVPAGSRVPKRHRCQPDGVGADAALRVTPAFESTRYGTADYMRLTRCTAVEIATGAEDEGELGVYHDLFEPQRAAMIRARLLEYVPAGCDAALIFGS